MKYYLVSYETDERGDVTSFKVLGQSTSIEAIEQLRDCCYKGLKTKILMSI